MFLGHIAVGFASKRVAPGTSLGWLMTAPVLLDLLWPLFLFAGIEQVKIAPGNTAFTPLEFTRYPWSRSLLMSAVWGAAFALAYRAFARDTRGAWVLFAGVVSHWVLDWISHRPDLPLVPWGGPKLGLGLWNHRSATIAVESAMFAVGLGLYLATTRARSWTGQLSLWLYVVITVLAYFADADSPPPPSVEALRTFALVGWLFVPWAIWIERTRTLRGAPA